MAISFSDLVYNDGRKDSPGFGEKAIKTAWGGYTYETDKLKERAIAEKEEYLAQFPESERGAKRAEMKLNNIKLSLELELKQRFTNGLQFYTDLVEKKLNRRNYCCDEEYNEALNEEAWKAGYEYGYKDGLFGWGSLSDNLRSFQNYHMKL